ncbi:MAG: peptidoglycan-associated lipoprotein Pal [Deltaproteobacteria bacterium]|nr:peptidoglycan-associated lipoprotein Pal [Deltaproteobacteria bacterium]
MSQKWITYAAALLLASSLNLACSKKGPNTSGDVRTEANSALKTVYFDFDQYNIRSDAGSTLKQNASWLKDNANINVIVEGNCDERGTNEYNMALGERRANAVKDYLVNLGIAVSRLSTVSYGEEKPVCTEHDESCWSKNRRADSVVRK